jgi:hypothetical protein
MQEPARKGERSEFLDSLRTGALIGAGLLLLILPPLKMMQKERQAQQPPAVATAPQPGAPAPQLQQPAVPPAPPTRASWPTG